MRISKISVKNFRSFKDVEINLHPYTSLVGPNGAGKSTILCALNIFFREIESATTNMIDLDIEDFHGRDTTQPIEITVTFKELSDEAKQDFAAYYRQDTLVVTAAATYDPSSGKAIVRQFGQRNVMSAFTGYFKLHDDGGLAGALKTEYEKIREKFSDLPKPGSKDAMRDSLRAYEEAHPQLCSLEPSEDQFYGFSKGSNRLAKYIQWVYVPAVKDATKENVEAKNTALGKILARTVRSKVKFDDEIKALKESTLIEYRKIIGAQQGALDGISKTLSERLAHWAHPEATARLKWAEDDRKVQVDEPVARLLASEGTFEGDLARFGHGLQRSYLLALLQELAANDDKQAPCLILGCEEPELYQHPPQARHLSGILQELSAGNSQVIVTTHSPCFVSGQGFESVRMVRRNLAAKHSNVSQITFEKIAGCIAEVTKEKITPLPAQMARLQAALQPQLNEMFFASNLILVEGIEDAAYITSWMILTDRWNEFRRHGCHLVPVNGKDKLIEPLVIAKELNIPVFVIFDADGNKTKESERAKHERDNKALIKLLGGDGNTPFPSEASWGSNYVQWVTNLGDAIKEVLGKETWDKTFGAATKELENPEGSYIKNPTHVGNHLSIICVEGHKVSILDRLCIEILRFASGKSKEEGAKAPEGAAKAA